MIRHIPAVERRPDGAAFIIAAGLATFGAVLIWDAGRIPETGGYAGIGPAAMPVLVGAVLIVLAVLTAINGWRVTQRIPRQRPAPLLWILGGMVAQISLLHLVGFSLATGILFACTAAAFGKRRLTISLPAGIGFAFAVYGIFDRILQLNLPAGPLETLIYGG